ncbi:MAG: hypothetical protein R3361_08260 [Aequorivita vladivostokensis]|nr:hypothetical protein [Aequorivita vladivostokensis]
MVSLSGGDSHRSQMQETGKQDRFGLSAGVLPVPCAKVDRAKAVF